MTRLFCAVAVIAAAMRMTSPQPNRFARLPAAVSIWRHCQVSRIIIIATRISCRQGVEVTMWKTRPSNEESLFSRDLPALFFDIGNPVRRDAYTFTIKGRIIGRRLVC